MHTQITTDFKAVYQRLKESNDQKFFIEFYHYDFNGEPFLSVGSYLETLRLDYIKDYGLMIIITTPEGTFVFSEKNHNTNISNDAIVFSSKFDNETYCIIEFG